MIKFVGGKGWIWENSEVWGAQSFANIFVSCSPAEWTIRNNTIYDTFGGEVNIFRSHNLYINTNLDAGPGLIEGNIIFNATHGSNIKLAGPDDGSTVGLSQCGSPLHTLYNATQPLLIAMVRAMS